MTEGPRGRDPRVGSGEGGAEGGAEGAPEGGPVPVRDLMKQMHPEPVAPEAEGEPRWEGTEARFEMADAVWLVRSAGAGAYGTGRRGAARLVAVHFFREAEPDVPVREALVPAGVFPHLRPEELRVLFERATPMDTRGEGRP